MEDRTLFSRMNSVCGALMADQYDQSTPLVMHWAESKNISALDFADATEQVAVRIAKMTGFPENDILLTLIMSGVGFGLMTGWEMGKAEAMSEMMGDTDATEGRE